MQAPTTLTRGNGFNRLAAGAIGLGALAASIVGAATLSDSIDLPITGGESTTVERRVGSPALGKNYRFLEANLYLPGYESREAVPSIESIRFLEQNLNLPASSPDVRSAEEIRFAEMNTFHFEGSEATTVAEIQMREANDWDYPARANLAGDEVQRQAPSLNEIRFIEDNTITLPSATLPQEVKPNTPH